MARVDVVLPVHGESPFLQAAVQSIRVQTMKDCRLVLVLDRPTPSTLDGVDRLQEAGDLVVSSVGQGLANALNTGIAASEAEYVGRLDDDDVSLPRRFEVQTSVMAEDSRLAVVGSAAWVIDHSGQRVGKREAPTSPVRTLSKLQWRNALIHPSVLMRRAALGEVGGFAPECRTGQDYELWLRLAKKWSLTSVAQPLIEYRLGGGQTKRSKLRHKQPHLVRRRRKELARAHNRLVVAAEMRQLAWIAWQMQKGLRRR